ncbi:unnamed protein product [Cunninghamella blakesleeana]
MIKKLILFFLCLQIVFGRSVRITNVDNNSEQNVVAGDEIVVKLTHINDPEGSWTWGSLSSNSTILRKTSGNTAPNGDVSAVFTVNDIGTSVITAARTCRSKSNTPCHSPSQVWKTTIIAT